ncbi:hypothetical protein [Nocardioides sp. SYSU D00038]|uniref:hypothetical protein n=1 Tax=Nocardioides sp. SYSU D00038 TaxID=2812554 RepID=UPI001967E892|nr:hypothetical protein [Nocardioides sp. SYSU D00038]
MTRRPSVVAAAALSVVLLGGCTPFGDDDTGGTPAPSTSATSAAPVFDSQFTRDGTFQSHIALPEAPGMDFVFTLYPTKATPRTNEWYPAGDKFFSFTFQGYDLDRGLRDPFRTKRKVYLDRIVVTSATTTTRGGATEEPYRLDVVAARATFDPEPVTTRRGMLVTSPKGAFELRNQRIGPVSRDTIGLTLSLTATVSVETRAGSGRFERVEVTQQVPIAIFDSDEVTEVADIPINAN